MRTLLTITSLVFILGSCRERQTKSNSLLSDSLTLNTDTLPQNREAYNDTALLSLTKQVLTSIRNKDYKRFANFIHPAFGVRFSPYGYIDTVNDVKLTAGKFLYSIKKQIKINWGDYDGSGEPILLTVEEYFKKFVYNADFLYAEKTSLNKMIGSGNSLNNLEAVYPGSGFTESYFSGFDKKFEGMDWCCLRLVYRNFQGSMYLIAIVHDQWTI